MSILGVVLAGGESSRFGSDKALAELGGRSLLEHAIARLSGWCAHVVVVGRADAPVPTLADWPRAGMGPLGGIAAGLNHALEKGHATVLSCGVDSLGLPDNLVEVLSPAPRYLATQPVVGHWPATAAGAIEELLFSSRKHSMLAFAEMIRATPVKLQSNPANINTRDDLAAAEKHHGI